MAQGLPVSNVVNVDVIMSPRAASGRNFGALLILGPSTIIPVSERIRRYSAAEDIGKDFGVESPEYKAAQVFFSQSPKPQEVFVGRWVKTKGDSEQATPETLEQAVNAMLDYTLMAMRRGVGQFSAQYSEMVKAIGFNADQAALSSNRFMTSLKSLGEMAGMARDKIGSNLADGLAGQIDNLRKKIIENFPKIEVTITKVIKGILWLGEIVGRVAFRIVDGVGDIIEWWGKLDAETKTLIEVIGGLVVAMRILNSTFWMSPIGLITGLIVALGLLWEDYKTWKEGGNSLIDWEKWQPAIDKAKDAITWLRDHLLELKDGVGGWQNALEILGTFIAGVWVSRVLGAFGKISGLPVPPWLKGWMAYAAYLYSDRENIGASAKSS